MVHEFIAFKSNTYTVMNEVCDIVINMVKQMMRRLGWCDTTRGFQARLSRLLCEIRRK